jgi:O-succinylbenzoate synthase
LARRRFGLARAVLGRRLDSGEALQSAMGRLFGNRAAKSALDLAWWDLASRIQNVTVGRQLGAVRPAIPLSRSLGTMATHEALISAIGEGLAAGCEHVTLKFSPGWDLEMLRAVRHAFPCEPLAIDCDGACSLGQQEMFFRLDDFFLKYIEQPLPADDLVGHAMLQENLRTPIALHQSVASLAQAEQAIDLGSCRMMRIELARVGGITPAVAVAGACRSAKVPCMLGMGPSGLVGRAAAAAVAAACDGAVVDESIATRAEPWLAGDAAGAPEKNAAGKLALRLPGQTEGWGVTVDDKLLAAAAVEQVTLR